MLVRDRRADKLGIRGAEFGPEMPPDCLSDPALAGRRFAFLEHDVTPTVLGLDPQDLEELVNKR